jgi:hypothetical protein
MKKLALALLLLLSTTAAFAATDKPDPAGFPVKVHVITSSSRPLYDGTLSLPQQILETTLNGQPTELTGISMGVLALGDYPARISTKVHGPRNPNTYDIYLGYDLLMPDGTTRTYTVTRLGPTSTNP